MLEITRRIGIGAQFGGKYFCHDVRVIRLPRHGASLPGRDRGVVLGRPAGAGQDHRRRASSSSSSRPTRRSTCRRPREPRTSTARWCAIDLNRPMDEIRAELSRYPVRTRLSLTGPLVVARDIAHAKIAERLDAGEPMPAYLRDHAVYYAGPAKTPAGLRVGLVRADHGGADGLLRRPVPGRGRLAGDAGQGQPLGRGHRGVQEARRLLPRLDRRRRRRGWPRTASRKVEVLEYPELGMEAVWKIEVRDFPAFIVVDDKGNDFFADPSGTGAADRRAPMTRPGFRIEHDSMGEVRVPAGALWGAQTQRAVENFPISGERIGRDLIAALGSDQGRGARSTPSWACSTRTWPPRSTTRPPRWPGASTTTQFPVDVFQTGSGTSSNMNANEVIATLAARALGRAVHPNDHVNASQSSNDVFPSAIHLAAVRLFGRELIPALTHLAAVLTVKAAEFADVVKVGRTHLMDAVPVTLGQEFGGYAAAVRHGAERVGAIAAPARRAAARRHRGGHRAERAARVRLRVIDRLAVSMKLPLTEARNHFEAAGSPGRAGRGQRGAAGGRGQPVQDLQRPALDGLRAAGRAGRDRDARPAAGILDHAGQGQPGDLRGGLPGLRAGDRERRGGRVRRGGGQLRAERDDAGDRAQPAGLGPPAGFCLAAAGRPLRGRDRRFPIACGAWSSPRRSS